MTFLFLPTPLSPPYTRPLATLSLRGAHPIGAIFPTRPLIPPHAHTVPYTRPQHCHCAERPRQSNLSSLPRLRAKIFLLFSSALIFLICESILLFLFNSPFHPALHRAVHPVPHPDPHLLLSYFLTFLLFSFCSIPAEPDMGLPILIKNLLILPAIFSFSSSRPVI